MPNIVRVNGLNALPRAIARGNKAIMRGVDEAIWRTAQKAVNPIRKRAPKAFGDLRDSVQAFSRGRNGYPITAVEAPHAAAVEVGARPHFPNFDRIYEWVRLRGMQGLNKSGRGIRTRYRLSEGPTTAKHAMRTATELRRLEVRGHTKGAYGRHSPTDAAREIAMRICKAIEKHGTRPTRFVMNSLPEIRSILVEEMQRAKARLRV